MTIWDAIIKGLVQGLAEFLPISSKTHLIFADHFLRLHLTERDTVAFDVMLHLGTALAAIIYFRSDIWKLLKGAARTFTGPVRAWREDPYTRLAWLLILGTIPAALVGKLFEDKFVGLFGNVPVAALLLLATAALLFFISRRKPGERPMTEVTWKDALFVGAFQCCALFPGISRSGTTISGGFLRNLDRESAARFSFLLSIPIILGGGAIHLKDVLHQGVSGPFTLPVLVAGFLAAAISGYLAVVLLLGAVRKGRLDYFAGYCVVVGVGMFAYWQLCVPSVELSSTLAIANKDVAAVYQRGELDAVALGQHVSLRISARPGRLAIPVTKVYAIVEPAANGEKPWIIPFAKTAGDGVFESEIREVKALAGELAGQVYKNPNDGVVREIRVIVRNAWGIEQEVPLKLRVKPEPDSRRRV